MKVSKATNLRLVIVISFLVALILNVYPLNAQIVKFRPMFLLMTLIFWTIYKPRYIGLLVTISVGFSLDLLFDTLFGQQTFCVLATTLCARLGNQYIKNLNLFNSWLLASLCLVVFHVILWLLQFVTQTVFISEFKWSVITSILLWPLLLWMFEKVR